MLNSDPVEFAYKIIQIHREVEDLRKEVHRLRLVEEKYNQLLMECVKHSDAMSRNIVTMYCQLTKDDKCHQPSPTQSGTS